MKSLMNQVKQGMAALLAASVLILSSCNDKIEDLPGTPATAGQTLAEKVNTDPNYSILRLALTRTNMMNVLGITGNNLTVFAPDNNAFIASGLSEATVNVLPLTTLTPLVQYHILATRIPSTGFVTSYAGNQTPNAQMPTLLQLPGGNPLVKMNAFPAKNGANSFVNNMPITAADVVTGTNGVMHRIPFILQPPSQVVKQLIAADANLSLFAALVLRGDVGQPAGLTRLDSVMNFGVANVTVFAPNNASIKGLINFLSGGAVPLGAPDATFIGFINANVPVATARGLVAYHMLGNRAFSVNLPLTTSTLVTLLGGSPFPPVTVDRSTAAPRLLGAANGPGNFSNFTATDRLGVNGVLHVIDRVLLPQ
ncbi:MAG: fasciclin domain-containing protein [Dinghuibacter sp.]|nr:fasciclin domain-containing protein [Dinghuibacter sp.]